MEVREYDVRVESGVVGLWVDVVHREVKKRPRKGSDEDC